MRAYVSCKLESGFNKNLGLRWCEILGSLGPTGNLSIAYVKLTRWDKRATIEAAHESCTAKCYVLPNERVVRIHVIRDMESGHLMFTMTDVISGEKLNRRINRRVKTNSMKAIEVFNTFCGKSVFAGSATEEEFIFDSRAETIKRDIYRHEKILRTGK